MRCMPSWAPYVEVEAVFGWGWDCRRALGMFERFCVPVSRALVAWRSKATGIQEAGLERCCPRPRGSKAPFPRRRHCVRDPEVFLDADESAANDSTQ